MQLSVNCAVIVVIYCSDPNDHAHRLSQIVDRGYTTILVDNTPDRAATDMVPLNSRPGLYHIVLGTNTGIANALNVGVKGAFALGKSYVFTFDQDSDFSPSLLDRLLARYVELETRSTAPLALGPHPVNKESGSSYLRRWDRLRRLLLSSSRAPGLLLVHEIISSGLLANRGTYDQVGLYDADLFIDFVDHEWCWRLSERGGACFVDLSTTLRHMVGRGDIPYTLGMKLGSPNRVYFLFRNGIYLILARKMPLFDAMKFIMLIPVKLLLFSFLPDRTERWGHVMRGISDGYRRALAKKFSRTT